MNKSTVNTPVTRNRWLSLLLVLGMLLTLLPTPVLAADAPRGYTTDSHGIMAYRYHEVLWGGTGRRISTFGLRGHYQDQWYLAYADIVTMLEVNGGENLRPNPYINYYWPVAREHAKVSANGTPYAVADTGMTVDIDANFLYGGKAIQLLYTVHNTNAGAVSFALGSATLGSLQIDPEKSWGAINITPFDGGLMFRLHDAQNDDAQLNLWYGNGIEGVTPVDTCWYGGKSFQTQPNMFTDLSCKTTFNGETGIAWSWKNRTIAAGETQTYSLLFSVGGLGSESMMSKNMVGYATTIGTKPDDVAVEPEEAVTLPTLAAAGYAFGGWYSDFDLNAYVGAGGAEYTPEGSVTLHAKWSPIQSPVNITVTKDGVGWTGQSLALYQGGTYKHPLIERGTSGVYSASVVNGTYDIYKDGADTGADVVAATTATNGIGEAVSVDIGYTTLATTTRLDGSASTLPGEVDYRIDGAVQFATNGDAGTYTAVVRDTGTSRYDVYVNALDASQDISVSDPSVSVNYFSGEVAVTLDSTAYEDRRVVLSRTVGTNTYYHTATDDDSDGVYTAMLPAGPDNEYAYTVSVDGRLLGDSVSYSDKTAAAAYYTAHVDLQKDGSDWAGDEVRVYLGSGDTRQKLAYTDGTDYQLILFSDGTIYDVLVFGSSSPQDTGFDVSSNAVQAISYWTVNFHTTDDSSAYTSRVIQNGKTVSRPSAPNVTGKSFEGWYTTVGRTDTFDDTTTIASVTNIFAKYVDPAVSIYGTVMDSSTYTIPNLTITGFPSTGTPVKTAILTVDSGSIAVTSGNGYTVTGSGSTAATVTFGEDGAGMETVQAFLRDNTVATPDGMNAQALTVTICGNTSDGSISTSAITISPVTLNLDGGTVNSGNLRFYQEGNGATLPTDLSKSGHAFAGWYESADCAGSAVTAISTSAAGEKAFYAKWTDSTTSGMIDFGTPVLSGSSFTYPHLKLTAPSALTGNIYGVSVTVDNGMVQVDSGSYQFVDDPGGVTTAAAIYFNGGKSLGDVESILRNNIHFTGSSSSDSPVVTITLDGNTTSLPNGVTISAGNGTTGLSGHYYAFVPESGGIDWNAAYNFAKTHLFMGMRGYLATIASAEENALLGELDGATVGWTGGTLLKQTDPADYDANPWKNGSLAGIDWHWRWGCGPEAGTAFHYGFHGADNFPVDGSGRIIGLEAGADANDAVHTNWSPGEPNYNDGVETVVEFYADNGLWNDRDPAASNTGYFVEFGGYPEGTEPGNPSENLIFTGTHTVRTYAPTASGDAIHANGATLVVCGTNAYWDMDSDGVLDDNEDDIAVHSAVSASTTIDAGTTGAFVPPLSGQITVLTGTTVGTIAGGNVNGPVCLKLSGDVAMTIDLDGITMVEVIDSLTGGAGDINLAATNNLDAERVLVTDTTGTDVVDMTKFTLNHGDNAVVAVGKELQISGYGVNATDSVSTALTGTAPAYRTATVEVRENGALADAERVVLKPASGNSITLNRSAAGIYSCTGLMDDTTLYILYVDGVAVGSPYAAFASDAAVNRAPGYYTAQVTYMVDGHETDAQRVVLKADGKDDITLNRQTDSNGDLVTGIYEYRALEDLATEYAVWVNGKDSGETLRFSSSGYQRIVNRYTTEVSLTNNGVWHGQSVTLRDNSGSIVYTLSETDAEGTYSVLTDSGRVGTYRIHVNGEDSGTAITPSATAKVASGIIAYMTATITTNKDDAPARLGAVTVGGKAATEVGGGMYAITLPAGSHTVIVAGTGMGTVTGDSPSLTANFYTVAYEENGASGTVPTDNILYGDGSIVTVLSAGNLSKSGHGFAGWLSGGHTYDVGDTLVIAAPATLTAQWASTAEAQASWTVDGTTSYGTFAEAVAAAKNTDLPVSITIAHDMTITKDVTVPDNAAVTLPEGRTVTVAENTTLTNGGTINSSGTITGGGSLDNNGTVNNNAVAATGGTIDIATDNAGGVIRGGTIAIGVTVSGGDIIGPLVNDGAVDGADLTGGVTNNGTLTNTIVAGDVDNNSGAVISGGTIAGDVTNRAGASLTGTTVNGNIDNQGAMDSMAVNGNLKNTNGTVANTVVAGTTTAPGGTVTTAAQLIEALGGAAHIDTETGTVVLDGDVQLSETIAIPGGSIVIDLDGHRITGPSGDGNTGIEAGDGGAAIAITGGAVEIEDNSDDGDGRIVGGAGGSGSTGGGSGGVGIAVHGGTLAVDGGVMVGGGTGGASGIGSGGSGGSGITVGGGANVTIEGIISGGNGGSSIDRDGDSNGSGGPGGSGVTTSGTVIVAIKGRVTGGSGGNGDVGGSGGTGMISESIGTVTLNGTVTGGDGGGGDTSGGSGGSGVENNGTGTVTQNGTVSGGSGATNRDGEAADSGTSLSGTIAYAILERGLTHMRLSDGSPDVIDAENGIVKANTGIKLECAYPALYDAAPSVTVGTCQSATGLTTTLNGRYYRYDSTTGVVTILENSPISGSIVITAAGSRKTGTVTITTRDELAEALENGFADIVINSTLSLADAVAVPGGTTLSIANGRNIIVTNGGSLVNNGTITGAGSLIAADGGSITNKGIINNHRILVSGGGSFTNRSSGSVATAEAIGNSGTITNDGGIASAITNSGTVYQVAGAPAISVSGTTAVTVLKVSYHVLGVGTTPDASLNVTALPNPLPVPAGRSHYAFNGWFCDAGCVIAAVPGTAITENTVLYADWIDTGGSHGGTSTEVSEGMVAVIVNGIAHNIGMAETSDGVTTVTPDQKELAGRIGNADPGSGVVVPITTAESADSGAAALVLQNIEDLDTRNMALTVEVNHVALTLPAGSIDTASVAAALGAENYEDVLVTVRLTVLSGGASRTALEAVESSGSMPVGSAFSFAVTAEYGGRSVSVSNFGRFTSRSLPIAEGGEITTAVVVQEDGTLRHVPTNGTNEWAVVNSLTNSTYVLIYNKQRFSDTNGAWYEDAVNELASRKIINGVGGDRFAGERSITRAEFSAILVRALGLPADGKADFCDIPEDAWYAGAVGTACEYGIVNGKSGNMFDPLASITRQEAMAMVARAGELAELAGDGKADLSAFADAAEVDTWAKGHVAYNVGNGLIVGREGGRLDPHGNISRAETATMMLRLLRNAALIDVRS